MNLLVGYRPLTRIPMELLASQAKLVHLYSYLLECSIRLNSRYEQRIIFVSCCLIKDGRRSKTLARVGKAAVFKIQSCHLSYHTAEACNLYQTALVDARMERTLMRVYWTVQDSE